MGAKRALLKHYRSTWRHSWRNRKAMDAPLRLSHEVQFLPAALALQEQPVHPAPRYIQWTIMVFAALTLLWACVGEIDVVATASGKIVPSGKTKVIQPNEVAVVKAIHVYDGQQVKAGELLVELDSQITTAEVERLASELLAAQVDIARAHLLQQAISNGAEPATIGGLIPESSPAQQQSLLRWVKGQYLELRATLDQSDAQIEQREAEIRSVRAAIAALNKTLPISRELAADYRGLLDKQYVAKHAYLEREQILLDQERELTQQKARISELEAALKAAQRQRVGVMAQTRRAMLDLQNDAEVRASSLTQELRKAEQRNRLTRLISPVDGTVQQLAIHTQGGVVTEAQPLMVIVPSDQPVEVEAMLENKDIGFVHPGQAVEVKVETFNFTKYGVVDGTVTSVSSDAIDDEKLGLIYSVRIELKKSAIQVGENIVALSPGMAARAEVKTDTRRVIDYFLSPLRQYKNEALGER